MHEWLFVKADRCCLSADHRHGLFRHATDPIERVTDSFDVGPGRIHGLLQATDQNEDHLYCLRHPVGRGMLRAHNGINVLRWVQWVVWQDCQLRRWIHVCGLRTSALHDVSVRHIFYSEFGPRMPPDLHLAQLEFDGYYNLAHLHRPLLLYRVPICLIAHKSYGGERARRWAFSLLSDF